MCPCGSQSGHTETVPGAGCLEKEHLAEYLDKHGDEIKDYGNGTDQDYPDVAANVAEAVSNASTIARCWCVAPAWAWPSPPTRSPGVRAVTAHDPYSAERARKSNDAQVLAMGARVIAPEAAEKVLDHWLASEFQGGGSTAKVEKMDEIDDQFRGERSQST
jgi:ribose 5-phosphate isomerase B